MSHLLGCTVKSLVGVTWHKLTPPGVPRRVPARDVAAGKPGGSQELTKEAEGLTLIFISCLLRYSGNLIFSQFSYFTSWKNGKYCDC